MKETFEIIKRNLILLLGIGLFVYNLFNFDIGTKKGISISSLFRNEDLITYPVANYYYYNNTTLIWLSAGAILITIGILIFKNNYEKNN